MFASNGFSYRKRSLLLGNFMPEIIEYKFELKFGLGNASKADRNCANIGREFARILNPLRMQAIGYFRVMHRIFMRSFET